jgi:hypothetical protein
VHSASASRAPGLSGRKVRQQAFEQNAPSCEALVIVTVRATEPGEARGKTDGLRPIELLDAVAVAMITPGPVVITVAFIGYLVAGGVKKVPEPVLIGVAGIAGVILKAAT